MAALHTDVINDVHAFWVDTGRPTLTASLIFRRGIVDETLATTGTTHLIEHLVLHERAKGALQVNGSVSLLHTQLDAHGPHDAVVDFLRGVTSWLASPELTELSRESSVLRAEAAMRGSNDVRAALINRYGARGPGLAAYDEPGLARVGPDDVHRVAGEWFTSGNCALFLDGPPPPGLALHLPFGPLRETPVAQACEASDSLPKMYVQHQGVTISGVARRSAAATILGPALQKLMHDDYRGRDGAAYAPWSNYEAVDDDHAVVLAGSDASSKLLVTVVDRTLELMETAVTSDSLERVVPDILAQARQAQADPLSAPMVAYRAATDHLRGKVPRSPEEVVAELDAVTPASVRAAAADVRSTLLLGVDARAAWADQMPRLVMPVTESTFAGRSFRSRNFPADRRRLVVANDGVSIGRGSAWNGLGRDDIEAVLIYPDGGRDIIGTDGWNIRVEPTMWASGGSVVKGVDELVSEDRRLIGPSREPHTVPRPLSFVGQVRNLAGEVWQRRALRMTLVIAVMLMVIGVFWAWFGRFPFLGVLIMIGSFAASLVRERRAPAVEGADT